MARMKRILRKAGLIGLPLTVAGLGLYFYSTGGRFVGTDNAYLKGKSVSISSDISGRVVDVLVHENEHVHAGDILYKIDQAPINISLDQALADYQSAFNDVLSKKAAFRQRAADLDSQRAKREFADRESARRAKLVGDRVISVSEFDQHHSDAEIARRDEAAIAEDLKRLTAELNGDPNIDPVRMPNVMAAQSRVDEARLDLARTEIHAPADGIVSQIDEFRPGDWSAAGTPVFSVYSEKSIWIEANLKETDLTKVRRGQAASFTVDAYPGRSIKAHVDSIGAATGAEFSVIPAENATGNWVKVVQRVPVRLEIDAAPVAETFIPGMSVVVSIDTGAKRGLSALNPFAQASDTE